MMDTSKNHSYIEFNDTKVLKYFDKYDFTKSAETIIDIKQNNSPYSFTKEELLIASVVATKFNKTYVKSAGEYDIINGDFMKTAFSNKDILIGVLTKYPELITEEDLKEAGIIMKYLEDEFSFKILADTLTDFETSITKFLSPETEMNNSVFGIAAYIPTYYNNSVKNEVLRDRSTNDGHLGRIGEKVNTEIEILTSKYLADTQYGGSGYMINAITTDNHRVTFFTSNEDIANSKKNIKVSCKIKALGTAWNDENINETKINYVRIS